jgi:hypothetical protein
VPFQPNPGLPTQGTVTPSALQSYNEWLKANYVVYLGRSKQTEPDGTTSWITVDITDAFFAYSLTPPAGQVTTVRDLMAHEDVFTNRRDQAWFAAQGHPGLTTNVLTLNLTRVSAFLNRNVLLDFPVDVANPALSVFPGGGSYASYFTGMIYLERTPRMFLDTSVTPNVPYAHPLLPNGVHPLSVSGLTANNDPTLNPLAAMQPIVGMVDVGATPALAVGAPGTWTVFPHLLGVRLDRGVNAQGRRMTIVTPNTCYLWGSFNTAGQANAPPTPCAIYADSVVTLSNAWTDERSADPTPPPATATTYRAAIVTHNVPTDHENAAVGGSGGAQNLLRLLEDWNGVNFSLVGCLVVPGRMRHTRSPITTTSPAFHSEPLYIYTYNGMLQTSGGQPPYSLKTTGARRVLSNVMR